MEILAAATSCGAAIQHPNSAERKTMLDIRGSLKNTKISSNKYAVIDELIANSIDAFLIRRQKDSANPDLKISVSVEFAPTDLMGSQWDLTISCTDNGCGLGKAQVEAFLTKDTSYKDDLEIKGIGKCKGSGRIQFFHYFNLLSVVSTYRDEDRVMKRALAPLRGRKKVELSDFELAEGRETDIGTTVKLAELTTAARQRIFGTEPLPETFSAASMRRHALIAFLQRLVGLRSELGSFEILFETISPKADTQTPNSSMAECEVETQSLVAADLPSVTAIERVKVEERDPATGELLGKQQELVVSHYKLDKTKFGLPRNSISLCANSSAVVDITSRYLRTRTEQNRPLDGFHHIILIEGDILDRRVNEQRDNFEGIPESIPIQDLFSDETVSFAAIYEKIDEVVGSMITPTGWSREAVVKDVSEKFGVFPKMLADTDTRVLYGDSARAVAERVFKKYQERIISETEEIFDLKEEIAKAEPHSEVFRRKVHDLAWRYTASLKTFDMANLSQLVVRRAAIIEILALACSRGLEVQAPGKEGKRMDERIIHSIFFPMKKDSHEASDHDIWLLSEEYQYYDYISSDKPLSQIKWAEDVSLFDLT